MKKDFLTLADGTKVRIEANWNAIDNFAKIAGIENIADLDNIGKMTTKQYPRLIFECASEGEAMEGRKLNYDFEAFKKQLRFAQVGEFNTIYVKQSVPEDTLKKTEKKKER